MVARGSECVCEDTWLRVGKGRVVHSTEASFIGLGIKRLIKSSLDAEGLDLKVLNGASDLPGRTDVILVDAAVCAPFQNSVAEVMRFMSNAGYQLIDIDLNRSPKFGVLELRGIAFLWNGSALLKAITSYE